MRTKQKQKLNSELEDKFLNDQECLIETFYDKSCQENKMLMAIKKSMLSLAVRHGELDGVAFGKLKLAFDDCITWHREKFLVATSSHEEQVHEIFNSMAAAIHSAYQSKSKRGGNK